MKDVIGGRYEIRRKLGSGGMASVYLAHDPLLSRDVAVKVPRLDDDGDGDDRLARFQAELRAIGRLNHPNVVTIYDGGQDAGVPYLVMEPVDGESLAQLIRRAAPLPPAQAVDLARQIAEALAYAHSQGIVHRDIKPQNVLVDAAGRAKVTDFGIAKSGDATRTLTGTIFGTPSFMAPEVSAGEPVTPAADIYALGVVLYQMLTGHVPFEAENPIAAAVRSQREDPEPPSRWASVPGWLEGVVLRALARDPAQRYATADELAADLAAGSAPSAPDPDVQTTLRWRAVRPENDAPARGRRPRRRQAGDPREAQPAARGSLLDSQPAGRAGADRGRAGAYRQAAGQGGEPRPRRRRPRVVWLLPLVVAALVGGALAFAATHAPPQGKPPASAGASAKPKASAGRANLLANGALVTNGPQPADWTLHVFEGREPVRHWGPGGPNPASDREITLESASGTDTAWISAPAKVQPGQTLTATGYIQTRSVPADGPGAALWIVCLAADGKEAGQATSKPVHGDTAWTEVQAQGKAPAGTASCGVQLRLGAPGKQTSGVAEFSRIALVAS